MKKPDGNADAVLKPKRFWKAAGVEAEGEAFEVRLDGRAAKTPAGARLRLPTRALAELVAAEWDAVEGDVVYARMPATRLAFTAIDRVSRAREAVADEAAKYAEADLICYFADAPQALIARQEAAWGPLLDWARDDLGLIYERASGIVHRPQPPQTPARARELALALDDHALTALSWAVGLLGSPALAFAVQRGRLTGEEAFDLSRVDETFQEEQWGVDAEAAERTAALRAEAGLIGRWFRALD